MSAELRLDTQASTERFGEILGQLCRPGDIICLEGELGAGKTTLTQAIARGAGIDRKEYVCSPTFAIMHEYQGPITMYHMDFYRLHSSDDVTEIGLDDYFFLPGIIVIEWYSKAIELIPPDYLLVGLQIIDDNKRKVSVSSTAEKWFSRIEELKRKYTESYPP